MKPSLQLKVSQQLALTPQLQQAIKLLQLSSLELQAEIDRILLDNPLLEQEDAPVSEPEPNPAPKEHASTGYAEDWGHNGRVYEGSDALDPLLNIPCPISLRKHLLSQLGELSSNTREQAIVHLLIEELDEQGYLSRSLAEIMADLPLDLAVEEEELMLGLQCLQNFEPIGVGARDLPESLCLQLHNQDNGKPEYALAIQIVQAHLALLANKAYTKLKNLYNLEDDTLRQVLRLISKMNPTPAAGFGAEPVSYIVPDISVTQHKGQWLAELNPQVVPKIKVQQAYAELLTDGRAEHDALFSRLQEARWLVKSVQQRFETLLKVADAIVQRQQAFFDQGELAMQPLVLREIADELGLHESTVSRVTTQKYLSCPRGVFELKYFFGSALQTHHGAAHSATAIKAHIRVLIEQENPARPLSDSAITTTLSKQGIQVARRTVAKYREAMLIPAANLRKVL